MTLFMDDPLRERSFTFFNPRRSFTIDERDTENSQDKQCRSKNVPIRDVLSTRLPFRDRKTSANQWKDLQKKSICLDKQKLDRFIELEIFWLIFLDQLMLKHEMKPERRWGHPCYVLMWTPENGARSSSKKEYNLSCPFYHFFTILFLSLTF